jgi:hypothetical protein
MTMHRDDPHGRVDEGNSKQKMDWSDPSLTADAVGVTLGERKEPDADTVTGLIALCQMLRAKALCNGQEDMLEALDKHQHVLSEILSSIQEESNASPSLAETTAIFHVNRHLEMYDRQLRGQGARAPGTRPTADSIRAVHRCDAYVLLAVTLLFLGSLSITVLIFAAPVVRVAVLFAVLLGLRTASLIFMYVRSGHSLSEACFHDLMRRPRIWKRR